MRRTAAFAALLAAAPAAVADAVIPVYALGASYPLVVSISAGAMLPLSPPKGSYPGFPAVTALRAEIDIGVGGAMLSGGVSVPAGYGPSKINLKAAALRTWLWSFDRPVDRTSHGAARSRFVFLYLGLGH